MKRTSLMLVLCLLLSTVFCVGCPNTEMDAAEMKMVAYGSSYMGSLTATSLLVKEEEVTVDDARAVAEVLKMLQAPLSSIAAQENLHVSLYPVLEEIIIAKLEDPEQQELALAAVSLGLRFGDVVLAKYPEIVDSAEEWSGFLVEIVKGLASGILDAIDEPDDSPLRDGLTRSSTNDETYLHTADTGHGHARTGLCRGPCCVSVHARARRIAHDYLARHSVQLEHVPQ